MQMQVDTVHIGALKEIFSGSNLILKQENRVNFNGKINKAKAYII